MESQYKYFVKGHKRFEERPEYRGIAFIDYLFTTDFQSQLILFQPPSKDLDVIQSIFNKDLDIVILPHQPLTVVELDHALFEQDDDDVDMGGNLNSSTQQLLHGMDGVVDDEQGLSTFALQQDLSADGGSELQAILDAANLGGAVFDDLDDLSHMGGDVLE